MRDRTVNRVESWDARPFSGGFATLRDMSDANFSGVVVSGDAWLFMLNGRIVGIVDGDIDDFEDASGTMYEAPDPSLPLLFSMQERAGTTQAKYYTNDTPLAEADKTLSDANFTGYVELSENVLSGDYYLVYYGGRALPVAFVGTTNELKTGDEAYELATDEVGVYEVIKTPVNVTQVPAPRSDEPGSRTAAEGASAGTSAAAGATAAESGTDVDEAKPGDDVQAAGDSTDRTESGEAVEAEPEPAGTSEPSAEAAAAEEYAADSEDSVVEAAEPDEAAQAGSPETEPAEPAESSVSEPSEATASSTDDSVAEAASTEGAGAGGASQAESAETPADDSSVFSEEEQWRQTKSIPSLSPSEREKRRRQQAGEAASADQQAKRPRSERPEGATSSAQSGTGEADAQGRQTAASSQSTDQTQPEQSSAADADAAESAADSAGASGASANSPDETASTGGDGSDAEVSAAAKQRITELQSRLERLDAERGELEDDLDSTRSERDELQKRVRQLENALEDAGGEATSGPTLTPDEALAGTNLFVRYGSRGAPTLDDLTGKQPDAEAINKNLRIDHHTQFESQETAVDGTPFEQFLEGTSSFRFVSWLVRDLPYEVLDAGHRGNLGDLYDVIPEIDRAELQGVVEVEAEDGNERREFDIVLRDRMGNPLVVAELNDERDPVSGNEMESLIESAQVVGEGADGLGAAFYVTASFFEPDALENAAEATDSGGILSRSDRASYVKLARKRGFHLCLAEDRNDTFHLTVPEL